MQTPHHFLPPPARRRGFRYVESSDFNAAAELVFLHARRAVRIGRLPSDVCFGIELDPAGPGSVSGLVPLREPVCLADDDDAQPASILLQEGRFQLVARLQERQGALWLELRGVDVSMAARYPITKTPDGRATLGRQVLSACRPPRTT